MTVSIFSQPVDVRPISFACNKYGPELLVDIAWIHDMPSFANTVEPYTLNFYDITLITGGSGSFWLDEHEYQLTPNQVLFTTPGQVRRWYVKNLQGICLFFPAEFLLQHFNDPLLLHRLRYFHTHNGPRDLVLSGSQSLVLHERLSAMNKELAQLQMDSEALLRSMAYEVMIYLNRWYAKQHGQVLENTLNQTVSRFRQVLESHYHRYHKVGQYAALLAVTAGHLNVLCQTQLGRCASKIISDRIFCEAARRLIHTNMDIETLSDTLGFASPSYFCRAFKREKGLSPLQYRKQGQVFQL
jgi:AraC-like DNA-binding protein